MVYGYVKLVLDSTSGTKKSSVQAFAAKKRRDSVMYEDYKDMFNSLIGEGDRDCHGKYLMTEDEFRAALEKSRDVNAEVFGIITGPNTTIQFEPFTKVI